MTRKSFAKAGTTAKIVAGTTELGVSVVTYTTDELRFAVAVVDNSLLILGPVVPIARDLRVLTQAGRDLIEVYEQKRNRIEELVGAKEARIQDLEAERELAVRSLGHQTLQIAELIKMQQILCQMLDLPEGLAPFEMHTNLVNEINDLKRISADLERENEKLAAQVREQMARSAWDMLPETVAGFGQAAGDGVALLSAEHPAGASVPEDADVSPDSIVEEELTDEQVLTLGLNAATDLPPGKRLCAALYCDEWALEESVYCGDHQPVVMEARKNEAIATAMADAKRGCETVLAMSAPLAKPGELVPPPDRVSHDSTCMKVMGEACTCGADKRAEYLRQQLEEPPKHLALLVSIEEQGFACGLLPDGTVQIADHVPMSVEEAREWVKARREPLDQPAPAAADPRHEFQAPPFHRTDACMVCHKSAAHPIHDAPAAVREHT